MWTINLSCEPHCEVTKQNILNDNSYLKDMDLEPATIMQLDDIQ